MAKKRKSKNGYGKEEYGKDGYNKKGLCRLCKEPRTEEGHDPCIANLPGVHFACCGHGIENGYIKFMDGRALRFRPVEMDVEAPSHYWAQNPVAVFIKDRTVLKFKNGKRRTDTIDHNPVERDGWKLLVHAPIEEK